MPSWPTLFVFVAAVVAAAFTGAFFKPDGWYRALDKPRWNPPDWVFPPAWTLLYLMIAFAGALAWEAEGGRWTGATTAWVVQLAFNAAWSWAFFGRHRIALAFAIGFGMLAGIAAFILLAYPASPLAAWLFVPYLAWVAFATTLTGAILKRNPGSRPAGSGSAA